MERFAIKFDAEIAQNLCKMCRLCGTRNSAKISILQSNPTFFGDGDAELWKKIFTCVGIKATRNDKMPQNICHLCHDKILDFFEFREMCLSIDLQTRKFLGLALPKIDIKKDEESLEKKKKPQKRKSGKDHNPTNSKLAKLMEANTVKNEILGNKRKKSTTTTKNTKDKLKNMEIKKFIGDQKHELNFPNINLEAIMNSKFTFGGNEIDIKDNTICFICGETYNAVKFEEHLKATHIPRIVPYHCVRCNETITKKIDIKNHNLWHKLSKTPFTCGRCSRNVDSLAGYTRHINECLTFSKLNIYETQKCIECSREFETQNLHDWHPCVTATLKCPKCNKTFTTAGNTLKHIIRCTAKGSRPAVKVQINHSAIKVEKHFTENNAFVVIPSSSAAAVASHQSEMLSNKKSKKITKKDMQRFDNLLKNAYETLQNIKQEPKEQNTTENHYDQNDISATRVEEQDTFHHGDDDYSSADDNDLQNNSAGVKQEVIDIGFEKIVSGSNPLTTEIQKEPAKQDSQELITKGDKQLPTIKLKIKKEHGTLNSSLIEENNADLSGSGSNFFEDSSLKKKKRKKKKTDKDATETLGNIKREPIDQDDLQTDHNETEDNCDETEEDHEEDNSTFAGATNNTESLPIICAVSSLANPSSDQNSDQSTLPVISSVQSGVEELPETQSTTLGVAIKQEILDDNNEMSYTANEVSTAEDCHTSEVNNASEVTSTSLENRLVTNEDETVTEGASTSAAMDVDIVQIKKEIDYEDYVNQTCEGQNNENYDNEATDTTTFVNNITIKEEIHLNYDDNLMDCDYDNDNEANIEDMELNRCKNINQNTIKISSVNDNETDRTAAATADVEKNLSLNPSDSVFTFKRIVLKNFENAKSVEENFDASAEKDKQSSEAEVVNKNKEDDEAEKSKLPSETNENDGENLNEVVATQDLQSNEEEFRKEDEGLSMTNENDGEKPNEVVVTQNFQPNEEEFRKEDEDLSLKDKENNCENVISQSETVLDSNLMQNDEDVDDVNMTEIEDKEGSEKITSQNNEVIDSSPEENGDVAMEVVENNEEPTDSVSVQTVDDVFKTDTVETETLQTLSITSVVHDQEVNDLIKSNKEGNNEILNSDEHLIDTSSKDDDESLIDNEDELLNDTLDNEIVDRRSEVEQLAETETQMNENESPKSEEIIKSNTNDLLQASDNENKEIESLDKSMEVEEDSSSKMQENVHSNTVEISEDTSIHVDQVHDSNNTAEPSKDTSIHVDQVHDSNDGDVAHIENAQISINDLTPQSESLNICDQENEIVPMNKNFAEETTQKPIISDNFSIETTSSNAIDANQDLKPSNENAETANETILNDDSENLKRDEVVNDNSQVNRVSTD